MQVYNTLTRKKEKFETVEENVAKIYVCGPTVYNYIHIGNARPLVVFDTLRRYLLYKGMDVRYVQNYTDIDDKIINRAKEEGIGIEELTEKYIKAYEEDSMGLNVLEDHTLHPRATGHIDDMIEFIQGLIKLDAAYAVDGNVYFDVSKAKNYGDLSKKDIEDLKSGARIDINEEKKNPLDFALWKARKVEDEPAWESPWGMGRPGWHIECSVMAKTLLGNTIDIHAGGADLQFPHHENEIAQSETLTGEPFAKYWMHNAMITMNEEKMSKSLGNIRTIHELKEEVDLEAVRFWLLSAHYRNPIDFSGEVIEQAKNGLTRMYTAKDRLQHLLSVTEDTGEASTAHQGYLDQFDASMDDDLNTADAISIIFNYVKFVNQEIDENSSRIEVQKAIDTLTTMAGVLGLLYKSQDKTLDDEVEALIEKRETARKNKDYAEADQIRDQLKEMGIELKDTSSGVVWNKVK